MEVQVEVEEHCLVVDPRRMKIPRLPNGKSLKIATEHGIVGGTIWPAASALCEFLAEQKSLLSYKDNLDCLELGSGTGVVGIFAAGLGFRTILTEHKPPVTSVIPSVPYNADGSFDFGLVGDEDTQIPRKSDRLLRLLQENVDRNRHIFYDTTNNGLPKVMELDWTGLKHAEKVASASESSDGFDLVLGSDITYASEIHENLADTIARLLRRRPCSNTATSADGLFPSRCIVAHQERVLNLRGQDMQLLSFERAIREAGLEKYRTQQRLLQDTAGKQFNVSILELRHRSSMFDSEGGCLYR